MPSQTLHHDFNFIFFSSTFQVTFHPSPFIFICPDPILNHFYLISALLRMFYENTARKFLKFTLPFGLFPRDGGAH